MCVGHVRCVYAADQRMCVCAVHPTCCVTMKSSNVTGGGPLADKQPHDPGS